MHFFNILLTGFGFSALKMVIFFILDRLCYTAYTDNTTDRENNRFAFMNAESVFSLFVLGDFSGELILLRKFRIIKM